MPTPGATYMHMQINTTSNSIYRGRGIDIDVRKLECPVAVSTDKELSAQSRPLPVHHHPEFPFQHAVA
eukprot:6722858-Karenia_brevis.AAC.1